MIVLINSLVEKDVQKQNLNQPLPVTIKPSKIGYIGIKVYYVLHRHTDDKIA